MADERDDSKAPEPEAPQPDRYRVNDAVGRPVPDTGSDRGFMTHEQWQQRDKAAGYVRVDETGRTLPGEEQQ